MKKEYITDICKDLEELLKIFEEEGRVKECCIISNSILIFKILSDAQNDVTVRRGDYNTIDNHSIFASEPRSLQ